MFFARVILGLTAALFLASGALATVFETGVDFQKFTGKVLGSFENDGKARKACICKAGGDAFNAAGYLDVDHDPVTDYFKTRCLVPHPPAADAVISALTICDIFEVVPTK